MDIYLINNEEEIKQKIIDLLKGQSEIVLGIEKKQTIVKVFKGKEINQLILLEEKINELIEEIFSENKGRLYREVIKRIDKPLIEYVFKYTEGNKFKSAKILGVNRNTLEAKIRRLGISALRYKI